MGILKVLHDPKHPQLCPKMAARGEGGWNPQRRPVTPKSHRCAPKWQWEKWETPQMLWHGPKMAPLCPKMAALCPKMAALCPKMAALCPKMAPLCPKMAVALWCSSHEGAFWAQIGHFWLTESGPT